MKNEEDLKELKLDGEDEDVEMSDFSVMSDGESNVSASGDVKKDKEAPHIANINKKKRVAKLDMKQYKRECRREE